MIQEAHVYEELANICKNRPVWPGDTISHKGAEACVSRGWAKRDAAGNFVPTEAGADALTAWVNDAD